MPPSVELQSKEAHCSDRIIAAVERSKFLRHEIHRHQRAGTQRHMLGHPKIAHRAKRYLADIECRPMLVSL